MRGIVSRMYGVDLFSVTRACGRHLESTSEWLTGTEAFYVER